IFSAKLFFDERSVLSFVIDSIDYDATGYMNAHIDYKYKYNGGAYLQHLSRLPGDKGGVYKSIGGDGIILLEDTAIHSVRVELADAYKNRSVLHFLIQFDSSLEKKIIPQPAVKFVPNEVNVFEKPEFELYLPEASIYDTVSPFYFRGNGSTANSVSASHRINDESIPVHGEISVRILPDRFIPNTWNDKLVMQRSGRKKSAQKAERQGEWFAAKFSDFGTFQLFIDSTPPLLNGLGSGDTINLSGARYIQFTPTDNFGIKSFRAELNGNWLRFTNDKVRTWTYAFDQRCPYGTHNLRVMVEDIAGNVTTKNFWIKRGPYNPPKKKKVYRKKRR
ncbi:MAG TPA: M23 family peptidase, partial [Chitinophagaceae bacterium]|nr:M23 family peptidase [Chitinophagaceae bacterium]